MSDDEIGKKLDTAEGLFEMMRELSDTLTGAVSVLVGEGWTEAQARELVVAQYLTALRALYQQ